MKGSGSACCDPSEDTEDLPDTSHHGTALARPTESDVSGGGDDPGGVQGE